MKAFEITWKDGAYRVSIPNFLSDGERRKVVELEQVLDLFERVNRSVGLLARLAPGPENPCPCERCSVLREVESLLQEHGRLS